MCIEFIHRHIRKLAPTQPFTTRDMLIYGTRSAVDSALCRMVSDGFITRVARGIFVRDASDPPSVIEIAMIKADSLKTTIKELPQKVFNELGVSMKNCAAAFARNGHSSSFETIHGRVYFKGMSNKKLSLLDTPVGQVVFALWLWGSGLCTGADVRLVTHWFGRREKELLWLFGSLMPAWLNAICRECHTQPRPRVAIE